jgi:hypothetical protein
MDCLKQFQLYIAQQRTFSTTAGTFASWSDLLNQGWIVRSSLLPSDFTVQGFKNINLYGIKVIGNVQNGVPTANKCIVDDWDFNIQFNGTTPIIGGTFTNNGYAMVRDVNEVRLGKYQNEIMYAEPIQSVTEISVSSFSAQGYVPANNVQVTLDLVVQIYFFYKYQDEDLAFL